MKEKRRRLTSGWRPGWTDLAVVGFFVATTLALTWPLILQLDTQLAGNDNDTFINVWANWWTRKALLEGHDLFFCDYVFFPTGVDLTFHSFSHFNSLLCLVLGPLFGEIAAQNLTTLLAYVSTGVTMYWLVKYLTGSAFAALVAGYVFTFSPFHVSEASHPVLNTSQWLPLFTLFLIRAIRERRKRYGLWAGFFLFLTALSSWHLFLFTCGLATLYVLYQAWQHWRHQDGSVSRLIAPLAVFVVVSLLLVGPLLYPVVRGLLQGAGEGFVFVDRIGRADLLQFFRPPSLYPGIGSLLGIKSTYLGLSVLVVAAYGAWHHRPQANFWALGTIVFFLLALGPQVQIGGVVYKDWILPWGWIMGRIFRDPPRITFLITFCLSVLVGLGLVTIQRQIGPQNDRRRWGILATIVAIMAFDLLYWPFPTRPPPPVSEFYTELAAQEGDFAILELPFGRTPARYYAFYQTTHEKRTVEGIASRQPQQAYAYIWANPFLASIKNTGIMADSFTDVTRQLSALADDNIRYLVLHKTLRYNRFEQWRDYMAVPPSYEDDLVAVYTTRPPHGVGHDPAIELSAPLGIDGLEADFATAYRAGQTVDVQARWVALEPPGRPLDCRLTLYDADHTVAQVATPALYPGWPTTGWQTGTIALGRYKLQLDPFLSSGRYTLTVGLSSGGQTVGREAPVGRLNVVGLEREFTPAEPKHPMNLQFGDVLRLLGYDFQPYEGEGQIGVTLYWRAEQRMSRSFKFFVHVSGADANQVLAQADVVPHNWTYPTTWWEADEVVTDEIRLPVGELPPGDYRVFVGVYDPETGERLPTELGDRVALDEVLSIEP